MNLKTPIGWRKTSWLYTMCGRGLEFWTTENKSGLWHGGGFEPETFRFQIQ